MRLPVLESKFVDFFTIARVSMQLHLDYKNAHIGCTDTAQRDRATQATTADGCRRLVGAASCSARKLLGMAAGYDRVVERQLGSNTRYRSWALMLGTTG